MVDLESLLTSALDLAARGFPVFRLKPGSKKPAYKGWQTEATTDPAVIRTLWNEPYNIGVKTGGGLVVVDIDVKNGKPGAASFKALGLTKDEIRTFRVRTASGGWHVYYRSDREARSGVDVLGPGLDVRAAGGYVVGPGSVFEGQTYEVAAEGEVASLPGTISSRLSVRTSERDLPERARTAAIDLDRPDALERAAAWLRSEAPLAVEGNHGDATTFQVAARLKDFGVSRQQAVLLLDEHWNERCSPPWDLDELDEKVRNAFAYGTNPPGSDHPGAVFRGVDVEPVPRRVQSPSRWYDHGDEWSRDGNWLYYELFGRVGTAVLAGPTQAGKTFVDIALARSLATGAPFFGVEPDERGGTALLFGGTEGSGMQQRLAALQEENPLPISCAIVSDLSRTGALGELLTMLREKSRVMQERFGVPLRLVVLETLSAVGLLIREDDNGEAGRAMSNLATLARELNCLVLTTHHPPKNGAGTRGASAIPDNADYVLEIEREGRDVVRRLELTKARNAEQRQLGTFTLNKVSLGQDERGREITSMTIAMGEPMARKGSRADGAEQLMQAIDFALVDAPEVVEGHEAAEYTVVREIWKGLHKGGKKGDTGFKRCVDYALDVGAIGQAIWAGERYLWRKDE